MGSTRVRAGQFIVAEVVLVLAFLAFAGPTWLFVGVAASSAAVLLATFGRVDGRWYYEAALGYQRFRRRRAQVAAELVAATIDAVDPGLAWLRTIAPDLRIRPMSGRSSSPVGVGTDEHGWFGAVATDGVLPEPALVALLTDAAGAVSVAQGVVRQDGRLGFVAVRLSTPDAVDLERAHGLPALDAAIGAAVHRVVRLLHEHGLPARMLDPDGLLAALVEAAGLDGPPQEHWGCWAAGARAHTFYLLRSGGWPYPLVGSGAPARAISVTADGASAMLVRVTAPTGGSGRANRAFAAAAGRAGLRLRRLDGEHAPNAYACSPSGLSPLGADPAAPGRFPGLFAASLGSTRHGARTPDEAEQIER
jgi:ESX secretion system protein EccE